MNSELKKGEDGYYYRITGDNITTVSGFIYGDLDHATKEVDAIIKSYLERKSNPTKAQQSGFKCDPGRKKDESNID